MKTTTSATCTALFLLLCLTALEAFTSPSTTFRTGRSTVQRSSAMFAKKEEAMKIVSSTVAAWVASASTASAAASDAVTSAAVDSAAIASTVVVSAAGPDWGIFEGKTLSLLHPIVMGSMLLYSISTAILGFQWRRQRTLGDEISALKKTLPAPPAEGEAPSPAALEIEAQVNALTQERKDLAAAGPRDKHFSQGAWLAFVGTAFAIEGPLNTYARAGKLFPGPHLYAGAGLVVLWALAAACVPAMQKGDDTARTVHIGANVAGISLFAWQLVSGLPILQKVWENTVWP